MKTIKATGKRTAETRSTYNNNFDIFFLKFSSKKFFHTNCALSRTGLAAFVICAGCGKTTCATGLAWVIDCEFAFDIAVYWVFELAFPGGCRSPAGVLLFGTNVSTVSVLPCASSFL